MKYFEAYGLRSAAVPWTVSKCCLPKLVVPSVDSNTFNEAGLDNCDGEEMWEWLGAISCGIDV